MSYKSAYTGAQIDAAVLAVNNRSTSGSPNSLVQTTSYGDLCIGTPLDLSSINVGGSIAMPTSNGYNAVYSYNTTSSKITGIVSLGLGIGPFNSGDAGINITNETINASKNIRIVNRTGGVYLGDGNTAWASLSDERAKDIIEPIENAIAKVSNLRTVVGKYKTDDENKRRLFLIAQDVLAVLPEAVDTTDSERYGLMYTDVIPLLAAAIKELSDKVKALEASK